MLFFWSILAAVSYVIAAKEHIFSTKSLSAMNWKNLPKDDDSVFHTLSLSSDGVTSLVAHGRSLSSCDKDNSMTGFQPQSIGHKFRKLMQASSSDIGEISLQAIIGSDDRIPIEDTEVYPFSAVGVIIFQSANGGLRSQCTGTMVSRYAVLTSAHCLWDRSVQAWNSNFYFYPGRRGTLRPYGKFEWANIHVPNEWSSSGTQAYDYAIIELAEPVGDDVGFFGYGFECGFEKNSENETYILMGYPQDKAEEQWRDSCSSEPFDPCNEDVPDPFVIKHTCDTLGGQSGSVLWKVIDTKPQVRGIHQGYSFGDIDFNNAIAVTKDVFDFIERNSGPDS